VDDAAVIARLHVRASQWAYRGLMPDAFLAALSGAERIAEREAKWRALIVDEHRRTLVAGDGARLLGFVECGPADAADADAGELYAMYLEPDVVGRGVGRALHDAAVADLRARGFGRAVLWVLDGNARARRFYEAAGWRADGVTRTETRVDHVRLIV